MGRPQGPLPERPAWWCWKRPPRRRCGSLPGHAPACDSYHCHGLVRSTQVAKKVPWAEHRRAEMLGP
ncbi:hypothetical protein F751_2887 [Auxenochlorella protothecoides]|uniref:Uncharacterized protein n=1 Tax=Auxenochlorella protothecoides TaxID=3075 RepID=A0A087SD24_AUXPR|nr:hypothetical protein F751_2887 [Auxenochlorella protothecoides]KFM23628.1 hypothetical protein F751_2887 [Auxenochlorella protothecoides]